MARLPGLDVFIAPVARVHTPNIFDDFFPISSNIGTMRSEDEFRILANWTLKAPVTIAKGKDEQNEKEILLVIREDTQNPDDELKDILHEIQIMRNLDHSNVLKFYEAVYGNKLTDVALVYEPIGVLLSQIMAANIDKLYEPPVIKTIMKDLYTAIAYLHQKRIIHRDIQPENITLSPSGVLKLWNFRSARKFGQKPKRLKINEFRYQAVELLMLSEKCDASVDVWSANCIFAQLWTKKSLFYDHGSEKVLLGIFKLLGFPRKEIWEEFFSFPIAEELAECSKYSKYNMIDSYFNKYCNAMISPNALDLIHRCFRYNPKGRPFAEECLNHSYFKEEPEACSVEDIITLVEHTVICEKLRTMKSKKSI